VRSVDPHGDCVGLATRRAGMDAFRRGLTVLLWVIALGSCTPAGDTQTPEEAPEPTPAPFPAWGMGPRDGYRIVVALVSEYASSGGRIQR